MVSGRISKECVHGQEAHPGTSPSSPDELPEGRYSDRELSWLAFNERVLDLARDTERIPLLERAKFLAIFSSNLDEFFMVRVAGLKRRIDAGVAVPSVAGMLPRELHDAILARTHDLVSEQSRVFAEEVRPGLVDEGIEILRWAELSDDEKGRMRTLFSERIFPILTPLAVDPSHPFPYIRGLSINLAVMLANPITGAEQFARVKVPSVLPRLVNLGEGRFLPLEEIISRHLDQLFTGMHVLQHTTFRVTETKTSRSRRMTPRTCCSLSRRSCCAARWAALRCDWRSRTTFPRRCSSYSPVNLTSETRRSSGCRPHWT